MFYDILRRPVISNCGTKILEFLGKQSKPIMKKCWSYIQDSGNFIRKIKNLGDIPEGAILVTILMMFFYMEKMSLKVLCKKFHSN